MDEADSCSQLTGMHLGTDAPTGWAQPPIGDCGFVSDCHSAALIDRDGSVDWCRRPVRDGWRARRTAPGATARWRDDDSGSLICTFWLAECLALAGGLDRAETWFAAAAGHANDLALMSEEADGRNGQLLGNFPQAFSNSAPDAHKEM